MIDIQLVRDLLLAADPVGTTLLPDNTEGLRHAHLLAEGGYLTVTQAGTMRAPQYVATLTWKGHEFLDTIREPSVWHDLVRDRRLATTVYPVALVAEAAYAFAMRRAALERPERSHGIAAIRDDRCPEFLLDGPQGRCTLPYGHRGKHDFEPEEQSSLAVKELQHSFRQSVKR